MLVLLVCHEVRPEHLEAFDRLVAETVREIAVHEPGTIVYVSHVDRARPADRLFVEYYRDRAAFDAHEDQPHTRRFLAERVRFLVGPPEVTWLETHQGVLGGQPIDPTG